MRAIEVFRIRPKKGDVDTIAVYQVGEKYLSAECRKWTIKFYLTDQKPRRYLGAKYLRHMLDDEPVQIGKADTPKTGAANLRPTYQVGAFKHKIFKPYKLAQLLDYIAESL